MKEYLEGKTLKTNAHDLERFKQGSIYQDIKMLLEYELDRIHVELENAPDVNGVLPFSTTVLHRLGGAAQAIRNCLIILEHMSETKKEQDEYNRKQIERRKDHDN